MCFSQNILCVHLSFIQRLRLKCLNCHTLGMRVLCRHNRYNYSLCCTCMCFYFRKDNARRNPTVKDSRTLQAKTSVVNTNSTLDKRRNVTTNVLTVKQADTTTNTRSTTKITPNVQQEKVLTNATPDDSQMLAMDKVRHKEHTQNRPGTSKESQTLSTSKQTEEVISTALETNVIEDSGTNGMSRFAPETCNAIENQAPDVTLTPICETPSREPFSGICICSNNPEKDLTFLGNGLKEYGYANRLFDACKDVSSNVTVFCYYEDCIIEKVQLFYKLLNKPVTTFAYLARTHL